ncbi:MAG: Fe-S cluster assembly protein SufD [Chloroflexi bacterium RBG_16_47_49]|nr:MAG: Fe-S cluster assembly protein SufD [Chloroflexi bacterium RBG_16_47_49]
MNTHRVITRTKQSRQIEPVDFAFTREEIPALSMNWRGPTFLKDYRERAWDSFKSLPMPTVKDEAWRRTDIHNLDVARFSIPEGDSLSSLSLTPKWLLKPLVSKMHGGQAIIRPDRSEIHLDEALTQQGVIFTDLHTAETQHIDKLAHIIGQIVRPDEGRFAALTAAMEKYGIFIYIPRGVQVEIPLHSVIWGPGEGLAYFSHVMVWMEPDSSLTYVHEAASPNGGTVQTLHSGIVEIHLSDNAKLHFVELQSWGDNVWNFSHERARVGRDANLEWIFGALGSNLTKNFSEIDLIGEGAVGKMSGFYFTDGKQHLDHDTQQNHLAPHTTSDLLFKGALKDSSRSVWQGMIYVAPGAQKTDGYQANRNLVLSTKARADSIPGLEILADDVRCTHGATVGKIDPDSVFYLLSRGIPYAEAEHLIVEGFFDPIMQRIPFDGVRKRFQQAIVNKMK